MGQSTGSIIPLLDADTSLLFAAVRGEAAVK
jgi:hypothetical protein